MNSKQMFKWYGISIGIVLLVIGLLYIGGFRITYTYGNSMPGSGYAIYNINHNPNVNESAIIQADNKTIHHKVIGKNNSKYMTKGINNSYVDRWKGNKYSSSKWVFFSNGQKQTNILHNEISTKWISQKYVYKVWVEI